MENLSSFFLSCIIAKEAHGAPTQKQLKGRLLREKKKGGTSLSRAYSRMCARGQDFKRGDVYGPAYIHADTS